MSRFHKLTRRLNTYNIACQSCLDILQSTSGIVENYRHMFKVKNDENFILPYDLLIEIPVRINKSKADVDVELNHIVNIVTDLFDDDLIEITRHPAHSRIIAKFDKNYFADRVS